MNIASSATIVNASPLTRRPFFTRPRSFEPAEFLKGALAAYQDDARFFVNLILRKSIVLDGDVNGYVHLQAKYLRQAMCFRKYNHVIEALLAGGAVHRSPYQVGVRAFGYRLDERFAADQHVRVLPTSRRLIRRLAELRRRRDCSLLLRMKPVHHALARQQQRLGIETRLAETILATLPPAANPFDAQGVLVYDIALRAFHFGVGTYGRVSNSITSLKRELRKALRVDGEQLFSVDLSCAQPALLCHLTRAGADTRKGGRKGAALSRNDVRFNKYAALVQNGHLYDYLLSELAADGEEITRELLKHRLMTDVLAKKRLEGGAEYPSRVEETFRRCFPSAYDFIRRFNRDGAEHANLIRELQRQESAFVIENVAHDLTTRHPDTFFITLHDSIYATETDLPKVEAGFQRGFERAGCRMTYKVSAC